MHNKDNTTEKVKALLETCETYKIGNGEYSEFIQDLEMHFPEIAQSYLELVAERDMLLKQIRFMEQKRYCQNCRMNKLCTRCSPDTND